jgi:hypothetical protein
LTKNGEKIDPDDISAYIRILYQNGLKMWQVIQLNYRQLELTA